MDFGQQLKDFRVKDTIRIRFKYPVGTDLTGYTFTLSLKKEYSDLAPTMSVATTAGSHPLDDLPNGVVFLEASSVDTDIPPGKYHFEIQRTKPPVIVGGPPDVKTLIPTRDQHGDRVRALPSIT